MFAECARTRVFCGRREGEGSGDDKEEREGGGREGDRGREGGTDTERDGEKETEREGGGEREEDGRRPSRAWCFRRHFVSNNERKGRKVKNPVG